MNEFNVVNIYIIHKTIIFEILPRIPKFVWEGIQTKGFEELSVLL